MEINSFESLSYTSKELADCNNNLSQFTSDCYHLKPFHWYIFVSRYDYEIRGKDRAAEISPDRFRNFRWRTVGIDFTFIVRGLKFNSGSM